MFSINKIVHSSIYKFPTVFKLVSPNKLPCRHVKTLVLPRKTKSSLGYVLAGGGCLVLGICFEHKFYDPVRSWSKNLKFQPVLADVTPRNRYNNTADILEDKSLGVVAIDSWLTRDDNRKLYDYGVGFVDHASELVITNEGFISFDQDKLYQVTFEDGTAYHARVVSIDNHSDLAALRLCNDNGEVKERGGVPTVRLCTSPLRLGEKLVAVTMQSKDSDPSVYKVFSGCLTNLRNKEDDTPLQMSTNVVDGAYGGPVLNSDGEVVGVLSIKYYQGAVLSIPYNYVQKFIERSLEHEKIILTKEGDIRRQLREKKEQEEERQRKEMEEIIEARKRLASESEKNQ